MEVKRVYKSWLSLYTVIVLIIGIVSIIEVFIQER
jgi:hypothetical protein